MLAPDSLLRIPTRVRLPAGPSFCFAKKKQKGNSRETAFLSRLSSSDFVSCKYMLVLFRLGRRIVVFYESDPNL